MKANNEYDLDSWKCGKARAFTHIPTHLISSLRNRLLEKYSTKKGRKYFLKKGVLESFFQKILTIRYSE